jgi:hypothetical protein
MSIEEYADITPYLLWKIDQDMGPRPLCMQKMIEEEEKAYQRSTQGAATVPSAATAPKPLACPKPETRTEAHIRIFQKSEEKKVRAAKATAKKMVKSHQMKKISSHFPKATKKF